MKAEAFASVLAPSAGCGRSGDDSAACFRSATVFPVTEMRGPVPAPVAWSQLSWLATQSLKLTF